MKKSPVKRSSKALPNEQHVFYTEADAEACAPTSNKHTLYHIPSVVMPECWVWAGSYPSAAHKALASAGYHVRLAGTRRRGPVVSAMAAVSAMASADEAVVKAAVAALSKSDREQLKRLVEGGG